MGCCFSEDGIFCLFMYININVNVKEGEKLVGWLHVGQQMVHIEYPHSVHQLHTYLDIRHGKNPDPTAVLSFIPVVVDLPDDVHRITLFKWQLPATHPCCQRANTQIWKRHEPHLYLATAHFLWPQWATNPSHQSRKREMFIIHADI